MAAAETPKGSPVSRATRGAPAVWPSAEPRSASMISGHQKMMPYLQGNLKRVEDQPQCPCRGGSDSLPWI